MSVSRPSETAPRRSPPAVNQEALKIGAALEHIKAHGNLDGFPADRGRRVALVATAAKQGLLFWNRSRGTYELTIRGRRRERAWRRASRNLLRDRQGSAIRSGINAVVTGASAVVAVGVVFLALHSGGAPNSTDWVDAGPQFTQRVPVLAPAQTARSRPAEAAPQSRPVIAAAIADPKPALVGPAVALPVRRTEGVNGPSRVALGEAARSLAASIGIDPDAITGGAIETTSADRDRADTAKLATTQKKTRRHRDNPRDRGEFARETRGPGYAYGPYGGARRYGYWSSPWYR
jgi:hypothetical protein